MTVATRTSTPAAPARPAAAPRRAALGDLAALTKPGITRLVLFTTATGFLLAAGSATELLLLVHTLIGAGLAAAGANALNMWWERDTDRLMDRTADRPLPAGRLSPAVALAYACALGGVGIAHLALFTNVAAAVLVATSLLSYVLVYTPLKRHSHHATLVGAIPGALPILAGWAATGEPMSPAALALFGVVFLWQMPHFYALAWIYRADYGRGGLRMLSVIDPHGRRLGLESTLYSVALLGVSLVPAWVGLIGPVYGAGAAVLGLGMVGLSAALWRVRDDQRAWRLFFGSIAYLPLLLSLMLLDRVLI